MKVDENIRDATCISDAVNLSNTVIRITGSELTLDSFQHGDAIHGITLYCIFYCNAWIGCKRCEVKELAIIVDWCASQRGEHGLKAGARFDT